MTAFNFHKRQTRRWWYAGATLVAVAFFTVFFVVAASADNPSGCDFSPLNNGVEGCVTPLAGSTFAGGDGNLLTSPTAFGTTDWQNVGVNCTSNPPVGCGIDQPSGTGDNSFGQGTKTDNTAVTVVSGSIPPNKSDLTRFYEASSIGNGVINSDNFLYLAFERSNVLGTVNMNFEINQKATAGFTGTTTGPVTLNRTAGDLLVTYDFNNGGGRPTIAILRWLTGATTPSGVPGFTTNVCLASNTFPCWGDQKVLDSTDSIGAVNNLDTVSDPIAPNNPRDQAALTFGETAIDLTKAGVFPSGTCTAFGSTFVTSRSSSAFGSEVKDFIAPIPVNISNCGSIKIIKHTAPRGQDQKFSYTSNLPAEAAGTVNGVPQGGVACPLNSSAGVQADGSFCLNDAGNSTSDSAGNTVYNNALQAGTYTVTEGADPSGFTFGSLGCTGGSTSTTGKVATINLAPGDAVTCTYVNQLNTATLATQVSNAGPVFPSTAVHDTATVTGNQAADTPGGTVTFFLCGPIPTGACDGTTNVGTNIGTGTLSGSGATASATSPDVNTSASPLSPGRYCFRAEWPGDSHYVGALKEFGGATGTNECFTVRTIPTTTTTSPSVGQNGTTTFGSSVTDHAVVAATLSGDGTPTGTVTFFICSPTDLAAANSGAGEASCITGGTQVGTPVTTTAVSPATVPPSSFADSSAITANKTGTWCWRALYTPGGANGSNYTGSSDASSTECFTVNDTTSGASAQTWLPNDSATVTAAHSAPLNGSLSIQLFTDGTCGSSGGTAVSGQLYSQTLSNATTAADRTVTSNNTTYSVLASTSVSWLVKFVSTDTNVTGSTHCEKTSLTITN